MFTASASTELASPAAPRRRLQAHSKFGGIRHREPEGEPRSHKMSRYEFEWGFSRRLHDPLDSYTIQ